jgi:hypothetical protein
MKPVYIGIDPAVGTDEDAIEICEQHGRRIVCRAVAKPGELQDAIMQLALSGQHVYTHAELDAINAQLDACQLSLREWIQRLAP